MAPGTGTCTLRRVAAVNPAPQPCPTVAAASAATRGVAAPVQLLRLVAPGAMLGALLGAHSSAFMAASAPRAALSSSSRPTGPVSVSTALTLWAAPATASTAAGCLALCAALAARGLWRRRSTCPGSSMRLATARPAVGEDRELMSFLLQDHRETGGTAASNKTNGQSGNEVAGSGKEPAAQAAASPASSKQTDTDQEEGNLLLRIKRLGPAGLAAYGVTEGGFWIVSIPIVALSYHYATGEWPNLQNQEDLAKVFGTSFAFLNVARLAVPLRIGLAIALAPWVDANIIRPFFPEQWEAWRLQCKDDPERCELPEDL